MGTQETPHKQCFPPFPPLPTWEIQGQRLGHPSGGRPGNRQTGTVRERTEGIRTQGEKSDTGQPPACGGAEPNKGTREGPSLFYLNLPVMPPSQPPTKYSGSRQTCEQQREAEEECGPGSDTS